MSTLMKTRERDIYIYTYSCQPKLCFFIGVCVCDCIILYDVTVWANMCKVCTQKMVHKFSTVPHSSQQIPESHCESSCD